MKTHIKFEVSNALVEIPEEDIIYYVKKNLWPKDVFDYSELESWATENGFIKGE
jgi:hypothetical protein